MVRCSRLSRFALLVTVVAGFVLAPALAQWDQYRCAAMGTSHLGRCCGTTAVKPEAPERRAEMPSCCELEVEGTEAPASGNNSSSTLVCVAPLTGFVVARATASPRLSIRRPSARSRAPPRAALYVRHSSFLL